MSTPKTHTVNYTATIRGTATYEVREDGTVLRDSSVPIVWDWDSLDNIVEWDSLKIPSTKECSALDIECFPEGTTQEKLRDPNCFDDNKFSY